MNTITRGQRDIHTESDMCQFSHYVSQKVCNEGVSINTLTYHAWRASKRLFGASFKGRLDEVQSLLGVTGIDIHFLNEDGCTSLYAASQEGHIDTVKVLLKAGCIVNQTRRTYSGIDLGFGSPLFAASENGHINIVKVLMKAGAKDCFYYGHKLSAGHSKHLWYACFDGRLDEVQSLLELDGIDIHYYDQDGCTFLYAASQEGHHDVVKVLLQAGCNVNQANKNGASPLYIASENGHINIVKVLMKAGGDVNQTETNGYTPLYIAIQNNHKDIVQQLLYANGDTYTGEVENGVPHGFGTFLYANGDTYTGEVEKGVPHGQGTKLIKWKVINNDGVMRVEDFGQCGGEWRHGKQVKGTYISIICPKIFGDQPLCYGCNKISNPLHIQFKKCPCRTVKYCNQKCQRNHWKEHKKQHHIEMTLRKKQGK